MASNFKKIYNKNRKKMKLNRIILKILESLKWKFNNKYFKKIINILMMIYLSKWSTIA